MVLAQPQVDDSSKFSSKPLSRRDYEQQITLEFPWSGEPADNPYIESHDDTFRKEALNRHWMLALADRQEQIDHWRTHPAAFGPTACCKIRRPIKLQGT